MRIVVQRRPDESESVPGDLSVDDQPECCSLERPRTGDHPCIPAGKYEVILTPSPHLGYVTPEVLNVPGRTAIRIHVANKPSELLGCTAVGQNRATNTVGNSKKAFDRLMALLKVAVDGITVEYRDPEGV